MPRSKYSKGLEGKRYFQTVVVSFSHSVQNKKDYSYHWHCLCDCGTTHVADARSLARGHVKSCGCWTHNPLARLSITKHGHARTNKLTREYRSWQKMRDRCDNPRNPWFHRYGGRGIKYCLGFNDMGNFLRIVGSRPEKQTLDRIDGDGNYSCGECSECVDHGWPMNVRWATALIQSNNQPNVRILTVNGRTQPIGLWAAELGIDRRKLGEVMKSSKERAIRLLSFLISQRSNAA